MQRSTRAQLFAALALVAALAPAARAEKPRTVIVLDRIVAIVNDEVITRNDLEERTRFAEAQLRHQGTPLPPREVLQKQILERMITDRVQLQFARETGLRVDEADLDRALQRIAEQNKLTLLQLREALQKDGVSFARFREDIRNEIILGRLREREVDNKIVVTEAEVDELLRNALERGAGAEEYNVSHIVVTVPEQASPEQIEARRARAEQALAQLRAGADFRQVAASFSDAPDALQGGALGWRDANRLPTLYLEALRNMRPGEVSALLRSANGFHLVRLNERRGLSAPVIVPRTRARHILIRSNEIVSEAEAQRRLLDLKERLENKADFAELARLHSEDASAAKGGELGWLAPGDTVPEFERAMNALQPGEVSAPVKTPFGWHLIQVLERRTEDVSHERRRLEARMALRARKADEAYQEWVRQLRDRAFIQYRLEER